MDAPHRVHVIACGVLALDLDAAHRRLGVCVSTHYLPGGLHNTPHELRRRLQEAVDEASTRPDIERIAIGYGVCGLGTVGLHARTIPLAIPRVQDCIALFLGSDAAYRAQFARYPGTYYLAAGWVEEKVRPKPMDDGKLKAIDPSSEEHQRLVAQYGVEKAEHVRRFQTSWQRNYQRAAYIDTGASERRRYAELAQNMAREYGWKYEEIPGSSALIEALLTTQATTDQVLIVPPHHVTAFDPIGKGLKAVPVWESDETRAQRAHTLVFEGDPPAPGAPPEDGVRLGLGIDAGGTYTDTVLYDFAAGDVLQKAKALTTKWDYTLGIANALAQLDPDRLAQVDLVALSTTLATNAVVEGRGQKVGLLIMPPYGLFEPEDIAHRPLEILSAKMEIDGTEIAPVRADEVHRALRILMDREGVRAFAVAGYASHANPAHEMQVKEILRSATGLPVTCGHDVSAELDYTLRAQTAALNGRIIPYLEQLLDDVTTVLERRGIRAPVMVVRSDGSMMSRAAARERPIETLLSGPAASVAGARFLARTPTALVVDIGGTTTDTATIHDGHVRTCVEGAVVGGWRTHVKALDMRTLGLGGDSLIAWERHRLSIGPRRVAPVSWLARRHPGTAACLDWLARRLDAFDDSTAPMEMLVLNVDHPPPLPDPLDAAVLDLLRERPRSLHELAGLVLGDVWRPLSLETLEQRHLVQRCGLTPTDVLHVIGRLALWDAAAAQRLCDCFARLLRVPVKDLADRVLRDMTRKLAVELIRQELTESGAEGDGAAIQEALLDNWLNGGSGGFRVRIALKHPIVGIGAPAAHFVPAAADLLETEAVIPPHADVANAIGAVTSRVSIRHQLRVVPNEVGRYVVSGLAGSPSYANFDEAHAAATAALLQTVREKARQAGTREQRVEVHVEDRVAGIAGGGQIFLGRTLDARLSGRPDLARIREGA